MYAFKGYPEASQWTNQRRGNTTSHIVYYFYSYDILEDSSQAQYLSILWLEDIFCLQETGADKYKEK